VIGIRLHPADVIAHDGEDFGLFCFVFFLGRRRADTPGYQRQDQDRDQTYRIVLCGRFIFSSFWMVVSHKFP
jgi:hypothetical protein